MKMVAVVEEQHVRLPVKQIRVWHAARPQVHPPSLTFRKRRNTTLDPSLYMRPIQCSVIGEERFPQGVPVNTSLIVKLKCGHIVILPQRPVKLRKLVYCRMCFDLWTERALDSQISQRNARKRERQSEEIVDMAKKIAKKKKVASDDRRGRKIYEYVKAPKADLENKHVLRIVHDAAKKIKKGTVAEISDVALKGGLADATGQDALTQTGVMLNRLVSMGSVRKLGSSTESAKAKTPAKKLKFKLKK